MNITNKNIQSVLTTVGKTFKVLNDRERKILRLRYGLEDGEQKTLEQIAQLEKVTKQRIQQIRDNAFKQINTILKYEE